MPSPSWRKPQGSTSPSRKRPLGSPVRKAGQNPNTSWEKSADWYDRIIGAQGSELYQNVVIPGALALLQPHSGESILDLGCGQGVFSRAIAAKGASVTGVDLSPTLISKAKTYPKAKDIRYRARDAANIEDLGEFDGISAILCIQNMPHLDRVAAACAKVLKPGGRMLWVLNHPCFRIPRQSAWGWDEDRKIQYRRLDAYASDMEIPIIMHPGQEKSESTVSFHHGLQNLMLPGFAAGLSLAGLQEWHSHKSSEPGPRSRAENRSRREFPLFLALLWQKR